MLIDGDHAEAAVRTDVNSVLRHTANCPLYIVMHDSFNPGYRRGILTASWADNPHVHLLETDYVTGRLFGGEAGSERRSMWCGFALAVLLPKPRTGPVRIHQNDDLMYRTAYWRSVHAYRSAWNPLYVAPRGVAALGRKALRLASTSLKRVAQAVHARLKRGRGT